MKSEILVADDERIIRAMLKDVLVRGGYDVRTVSDGCAAVAAVRERRPDLLLLDVMMPRMDGRAACEAVRAFDKTLPIVFLTALDSDRDAIAGLAAGADDYVSKGASADLLLSRLEAVLRRARQDALGGAFVFEGWQVEAAGCVMQAEDGAIVALTDREVFLLRLFRAHPREVFDRDYLVRRLWGDAFEDGGNALTMVVKRLRTKLGAAGARLVAVRGAGYAYEPRRDGK